MTETIVYSKQQLAWWLGGQCVTCGADLTINDAAYHCKEHAEGHYNEKGEITGD